MAGGLFHLRSVHMGGPTVARRRHIHALFPFITRGAAPEARGRIASRRSRTLSHWPGCDPTNRYPGVQHIDTRTQPEHARCRGRAPGPAALACRGAQTCYSRYAWMRETTAARSDPRRQGKDCAGDPDQKGAQPQDALVPGARCGARPVWASLHSKAWLQGRPRESATSSGEHCPGSTLRAASRFPSPSHPPGR